MTYFLNLENTGLDTDEQVEVMAGILTDAGYDVGVTRNLGAVNSISECPVSIADWESALVAASKSDGG